MYSNTATTTSSTVTKEQFFDASEDNGYAPTIAIVQNKGSNNLYCAPSSSTATTDDLLIEAGLALPIPFFGLERISLITTWGDSAYTIKVI